MGKHGVCLNLIGYLLDTKCICSLSWINPLCPVIKAPGGFERSESWARAQTLALDPALGGQTPLRVGLRSGRQGLLLSSTTDTCKGTEVTNHKRLSIRAALRHPFFRASPAPGSPARPHHHHPQPRHAGEGLDGSWESPENVCETRGIPGRSV